MREIRQRRASSESESHLGAAAARQRCGGQRREPSRPAVGDGCEERMMRARTKQDSARERGGRRGARRARRPCSCQSVERSRSVVLLCLLGCSVFFGLWEGVQVSESQKACKNPTLQIVSDNRRFWVTVARNDSKEGAVELLGRNGRRSSKKVTKWCAHNSPQGAGSTGGMVSTCSVVLHVGV